MCQACITVLDETQQHSNNDMSSSTVSQYAIAIEDLDFGVDISFSDNFLKLSGGTICDNAIPCTGDSHPAQLDALVIFISQLSKFLQLA